MVAGVESFQYHSSAEDAARVRMAAGFWGETRAQYVSRVVAEQTRVFFEALDDIGRSGKMNRDQVQEFLNQFDAQELFSVAEQVNSAVEAHREEALTSAWAKIEEIARGVHMTPAALARKMTPPSKKYTHPETGQHWSGRGKRPAWILEWTAQGRSLEDLVEV